MQKLQEPGVCIGGKLVQLRAAAQLKEAPPGQRQHEGISFLDLPGEIRNLIYQYTLDIPCTRVPYNGYSNSDQIIKIDSSFHLLCVCRQIGNELGYMFINRSIAYIPVNNLLKISSIYYQIFVHGQHSLAPHQATILAALTDVKDLHLQLHAYQSLNPSKRNALLLCRLMEVIRHISLPCALHHARWCGERRKVLVHLDRYLVDDWPTILGFHDCSLANIIIQMGKNQNIDWTLAYYVQAESGSPHSGASVVSFFYRRAFESTLLQKCLPYNNIRLRQEIY